MDCIAENNKNLSAKWLYLAWLGFVFCSIIIGLIGTIYRGDPQQAVESWGIFNDFTIFTIPVYVLGSVIAVLILFKLMRENKIDLSVIGFRGNINGASLVYILIFIILWSFFPAILYLKFDSLYPAIVFHMFNNLLAFIGYPLVL